MLNSRTRSLYCASAVALMTAAFAAPVAAQTAPAEPSQDEAAQVDEVVVTGIRGALRSALNT